MIVGCDLFLDLWLYKLPSPALARLKKRFPKTRFVPVNVPGAKPALEEIEVYFGNRITAELIRAMPKLRWIHFGSAGVNRARVPEVKARRIAVTNSRGVMTGAVAASALSLMTALARGLHRCWRLRDESRLTRGAFDRWSEEVHDLEGERCLIAGLGESGLRLAAACRALGMEVRGLATTAKRRGGVPCATLASLDQEVRSADFVVNMLPLTDETEGVFTKRTFAAMKRSAFFINVGRGETVDEPALIAALKSRKIAGAGLDVFAKEPLDARSPLWTLDSAILTPHIAGLSRAYWLKQEALFAQNLARYLSGKPLKNLVDPGKGY